MIVGQLSFDAIPTVDGDAVEEAVESLLGALWKNGQVLGRDWPLAWDHNTLYAHAILPAKDALQQENSNKYVADAYSALRNAGIENFHVKVTDDFSERVILHTQHSPSSFILYTTFVVCASPLTCGDCLTPIPLYKIPPTYDDSEYYDVLSWEADYQACDTLQMNCRNGEAFAIRQMSLPTSSLSRQGREICSRIEALTQIPTYYYLYRYVRRTTAAREQERRCPACDGEWLLPEPWHLFDFRCDPCRLVSNISYTVRHN